MIQKFIIFYQIIFLLNYVFKKKENFFYIWKYF